MSGLKDMLEFIRAGGESKRYHVVRTLFPDTIAQHSFHVAWLCWTLSLGAPSAALIMAALAHDLAEHATGDVPAPLKRRLNIRAELGAIEDEFLAKHSLKFELTAAEQRVLGLSDALDGMWFCIREQEMGNSGMVGIYNNFSTYVRELKPEGLEMELVACLQQRWRSI